MVQSQRDVPGFFPGARTVVFEVSEYIYRAVCADEELENVPSRIENCLVSGVTGDPCFLFKARKGMAKILIEEQTRRCRDRSRTRNLK
jgi:hypothetical protein